MKRFAKNGKHYLASSLLQIPGIIINDLFIDESHVKIVAKIKLKHGTCPICSKKSKRLHSIYTRKLRDLAISSKSVVIELQVRKLFCDNIKCKKKIFSQQLDYQIKKYSRRTNRANDCLFELSKETSASKCSGFSKVIQIPVSSSTCLRLVTNSEVSPYKEIKHLGIDDWAFRKGKTYGTIMVDRVTGKTIDIINSRDKNDIVNWLKMFPEIETVTRDRSDTYAQSISIALPNTVQIADRFHLVVNYSDYIIKTINRLLPEIRQSILKVNSNDNVVNNIELQMITNLCSATTLPVNEKSIIILETIKKMKKDGYSISKISRTLNIDRKTVSKYIGMNKINTTYRKTKIDYTSYLNDIISGYSNGDSLSQIFRVIDKKGFKGSLRGLTVRFSAVFKKRGAQRVSKSINYHTDYFPKSLSPRKLSIYLTNKNYKKILSITEIEWFDKIKEYNPAIQSLCEISANFRNSFEEKSLAKFNEWINQVRDSSFSTLKRFVNSLMKDYNAVIAAVVYNQSNGLTEGCVNRLKNIKRQMYGRAGFELLRRKVVLSNFG